ncbi:MAG: 50S ribosomal protein L7/L12 [Candidatus Curtissbacteria bacterium GW2011_GWD1_40_8]|nr:MAG: 50S ribosomal protein L7/L12 [Candidatus Curtissbacteria bacterium GW2011_GWB1_40_28]KKR60206.1 MAG: 50S ribosomal protein L7/L12 [Candidatus Curtissbacteria bacterium GW2011_GWA2_40_31]KKR61284.1 MAG: ribosomal protein L7/L12, large subunit ribosomal protein L7/L12 [Microgenomates group bacterium GW2011_GWC1_40_35]KKR75394.1 MAG: 50S ribosomal protein L7/L12 [Candidatus Curtissbacteria bacterium GW2011_GWD1_40_8]KKS00437.1 MAG: 50S ribosomal protein L7/L12 [Candidatus Curtissbacteria b
MPDDDKKQDEKVEEVAEDAQKAAESAEESAEKAQEAAEKAEEAAEEVKEEVKGKKAEETKPPKPSVKVSKKLEDIIGQIEKLSVLELSELVKALEEKFGVSAAPMAIAANGAAGSATADEGASEQTTFNVIIADSGATKISVIKAVRELVPTLGLKEAKDLVDAAPKQLMEGVNKETAQEAKTKLETAGAKVELK